MSYTLFASQFPESEWINRCVEEAPDHIALQGDEQTDWPKLQAALGSLGYSTRYFQSRGGYWVGLAGSNFNEKLFEWEARGNSGACAIGWRGPAGVFFSVTDGGGEGEQALMTALCDVVQRFETTKEPWFIAGGFGVAPFPDDWTSMGVQVCEEKNTKLGQTWIRLLSAGLTDGLKPFVPSGTATRAEWGEGIGARMDHILVSREGVFVRSAGIFGEVSRRERASLVLHWEPVSDGRVLL